MNIDLDKFPESTHYFLQSADIIAEKLADLHSYEDLIEFKEYQSAISSGNGYLLNSDVENIYNIFPSDIKQIIEVKPEPIIKYVAYKEGKVYQFDIRYEAEQVSNNVSQVVINQDDIDLHKKVNKVIGSIIDDAMDINLSKQAFNINFHQSIMELVRDEDIGNRETAYQNASGLMRDMLSSDKVQTKNLMIKNLKRH